MLLENSYLERSLDFISKLSEELMLNNKVHSLEARHLVVMRSVKLLYLLFVIIEVTKAGKN